MYSVKPLGINIKDNERIVKDGFLQESINLQWTDGSFRPIPNRVACDITPDDDWKEVIFHKVGDEDQINVLVFKEDGLLYWVGKFVDGNYSALDSESSISDFTTVTDFDSLSFTILSGLIYFMSSSQQFYLRLQYDETDEDYEVKDMYGWKDFVMYYPNKDSVTFNFDHDGLGSSYAALTCGCIAIRFALVLKTGEIVLPTPPYFFFLKSLFYGSSLPDEDDTIPNIHTFINLNLNILDANNIYDDEISGINIYASIGDYLNTYPEDISTYNESFSGLYTHDDIKDQIQKQTESTFYLISTIDEPSDEKLLFLYAGTYQSSRFDFSDDDNVIKIDITSIAAGEEMPVDDNTYHKLYGKITAYNNRLIIEKPKTFLNNTGFGRSLGILDEDTDYSSRMSYKADTEDGALLGGISKVDKSIKYDSSNSYFVSRGVLGYPFIDSTYLSFNGNDGTDENDTKRNLSVFKLKESDYHNAAFYFKMTDIEYSETSSTTTDSDDSNVAVITKSYYINICYPFPSETRSVTNDTEEMNYTSDNRIQFSDAGEYAVWPVDNSYRVGNGVIKFVGNNSIDPANGDYMAALIIGTTEGIFTANMDTSGSTFIQTITKAVKSPVISENSIEVDQSIICMTDAGLMAVRNGTAVNLTKDFFPDFGRGNFLLQETTFPNYKTLTSNLYDQNDTEEVSYLSDYVSMFLGGSYGSLVYALIDIREYMKDAIFAYESGRGNLWCCNSGQNYSLVYNIQNKVWSLSTYKFTKALDFSSAIETNKYGNVYSLYILLSEDNNLDILNCEDQDTEVDVLFLTRAIKGGNGDVFKNINRLIVRCELYRSTEEGYFALGLWGKQDLNKSKVSIPLIAYSDDSETAWPDDIRQDLPIGTLRGKYKAMNLLFAAKILPESSIDRIDIEYKPVNNKNIR